MLEASFQLIKACLVEVGAVVMLIVALLVNNIKG